MYYLIETKTHCNSSFKIKECSSSRVVWDFVSNLILERFCPLKFRKTLKTRYVAVLDDECKPLFCIIFNFDLK